LDAARSGRRSAVTAAWSVQGAVPFPDRRRTPDRRDSGLKAERAARFSDGYAMVAIVGMLVAVTAGQGSDLVTFVGMMLAHGPAAEANPLVWHAVTTFGLPAVIVIKVVLVLFVVVTFAIVARNYRRVAAIVATVGTFVGLIGAYTNILAMRP
jgi:hypothetical protein